MNKTPYLYTHNASTTYRFLSTGKKSIEKIVIFTPLNRKNFFNLGFGDLLPEGKIDDRANSNNGDIVKVFSTIIHIAKDFTETNPDAKIAFKGSTKQRTELYQRILKTYLNDFLSDFFITALQGPENSPKETVFDPEYKGAYLAFFITRKL